MNRRYEKLTLGNLWRKVTFTDSKTNVSSSSKFSIYLSNIQRNALKSSIMRAIHFMTWPYWQPDAVFIGCIDSYFDALSAL